MNLIKTSAFSAISTVVKLITGFVISKILALYVGPSGFAWFGQFQNFIQIVQSASGNMINTGIIKYVAQHRQDSTILSRFLSTGLRLNFYVSVGTGAVIALCCSPLSWGVFGTGSYKWLFLIFGVTLCLYTFQFFLLSVLNGEGDIPFLTFASISSNLVSLGLTLWFVKLGHASGALLALVLAPALSSLITLGICWRRPWFRVALFSSTIDWKFARKLFRYAAMALTSALIIPASQFIIRAYIARSLSWNDAGIWQAMMRISDGYLMLITSVLSIYYLPKLASLHTPKELRTEIWHGYRLILPVVSLMAFGVYVLRIHIISILFSQQFISMSDLFAYQMVGDVLKIGSWLMAYLMLAKSMTRLYIGTEMGFTLSYILLTILCVYLWGLKGATIGFAINYAFYWLFIFVRIRPLWLSHP